MVLTFGSRDLFVSASTEKKADRAVVVMQYYSLDFSFDKDRDLH